MSHKLSMLLTLAFALACGNSAQTELTPTSSSAAGEPEVELGLGTVDGLPGTPLKLSENGVPMIEGVERPDYAEGAVNSFAARAERASADNPTGEYRFMLDGDSNEITPPDAPQATGFANAQERYNYCLLHDCEAQGPEIGSAGQPFIANVFFGAAFDSINGQPNVRGACWATENSGRDCEFPSQKSFKWAMIDPQFGPQFSQFYGCGQTPDHGGVAAPGFYNPPHIFFQEAANLWKPEAVITKLNFGDGQNPISDGSEFLSMFCDDLPGTFFGGIMGASGGFGPLTRRVTSAKAAYPSCPVNMPGGASFPRSLFTYSNAELRFDPDNLYQRLQACGGTAKLNDIDGLHIASVNMFAHEIGHVLGFSHFGTGIMAQGGSCTTFYLQNRTIPTVFHQALANYTFNNGTFNFVPGADCSTAPFLPAPQPNSTTQITPGAPNLFQ